MNEVILFLLVVLIVCFIFIYVVFLGMVMDIRVIKDFIETVKQAVLEVTTDEG